MALAVGPSIVSSGLVLALDAGDRLSYFSNGQGTTTWYDLSGNFKNFTVTVEASATAWDSGGFFNLNDNRNFNNSTAITTSTSSTVVFWLKTNDTQALLVQGAAEGSTFAAAYQPNYPSAGLNEFYSNNAGTPTYHIDLVSVASPNLDNNWHMWEIKSLNMSAFTRFNFNNYTSYKFGSGSLAAIYVYNRTLTAAESAQNYNALKRRFGK